MKNLINSSLQTSGYDRVAPSATFGNLAATTLKMLLLEVNSSDAAQA
ncbi:hypothetical protein ACWEN6_24060 [Sphaerisporangium sp. NPDC004334]